MKTIAIMNVKGGVGKTVTTVNMATILAEFYGKRVLVIDADPQGDTSAFFHLAAPLCRALPFPCCSHPNQQPRRHDDGALRRLQRSHFHDRLSQR